MIIFWKPCSIGIKYLGNYSRLDPPTLLTVFGATEGRDEDFKIFVKSRQTLMFDIIVPLVLDILVILVYKEGAKLFYINILFRTVGLKPF